ncbi:TolC family outer membrane protein [Eoetvoesiella caeni]
MFTTKELPVPLTCRLTLLALAAAMAGTPLFMQTACAQTANTLQQTVERTVLSNPEIRARFQNLQASLEGQNVVKGGLLPQVDLQGQLGHEWRSQPDSPSYNWSRPSYSLQLKQLLFDGFSTSNNIKQLGFEKLSNYYELLATTDSVVTEAISAYLNVERYRAMILLAKDNFAMHERTLKLLQERQESGVGRGVDLEQANARLALAQSNFMTETGNLNDVLQRYRRIVGEPAAAQLTASPSVAALLPAKPDDFRQSLLDNPSILSKQALVQAAQAGKASASGRFSPTVQLQASTGTDRQLPDDSYRNQRSTNVQVVLSYNLYRGGADSARMRQTSAQWYSARDVRDYTCRNAQQELSTTWNNIMRLRQQMPFLRKHEQAMMKVGVAAEQQFQIGQRTLLDLLDSANELFDARRALLNGQYDLKQLEYRWLALSHQVLPALDLSNTRQAIPENAKLAFPEESLASCLTPTPDTSNLEALSITYHEGMLPPTLSPLSSATPAAAGRNQAAAR